MLVLSRKNLQEIMIGDDIKITVLQVKGNVVRLGIEAPRSVRVRRGELAPEHESVVEEVTFSLTNEPDGTARRILPFQSDRDNSRSIGNIPDAKNSRLGRIREMLARIRHGEKDGEQ